MSAGGKSSTDAVHIEYEEILPGDIQWSRKDMATQYLQKGSYSTVKQARWNNKTVAVKCFFNPDKKGGFKDELIFLGLLQQSPPHENIVRLLGVCMSGPSPAPFIVLEFAPLSLEKVLYQRCINADVYRYQYSADHVICWAYQLSLGLEFVHSKQLMHRDVNPSNILLFNDGRNLKLCDFGTASKLSHTVNDTLGTIRYMAPEVIRGINYSSSCDVFSFAIVVWEVITRRKPIFGMNDISYHAIMYAVATGARPPPIKNNPRILSMMLDRCWAEDSEERPPMSVLVQKLDKLTKYVVVGRPLIMKGKATHKEEEVEDSEDQGEEGMLQPELPNPEFQRLYTESLKMGFVESSNTVCLLNGTAGTGKTHVKYLISKKRPPQVRHSTPVSEAPVRAFTCNRYNPTDEEWHEVDTDKEIEFLAAKMAEGVHLEDKPSISVSPKVDELPSHDSSHVQENVEQENVAPPSQAPPSQSPLNASATSQEQGGSQSLSSVPILDKPPYDPLNFIRCMSLNKKSKPYCNVDWVFIFDSGGQPAFQEMMPFFFPKIAVILFVMKLSESFDEHPIVRYFYKGEQVGTPYPSPLTNLEIFQQSFLAIQSQISMHDSKSTVPKMLLVGTHRDQESSCSETRSEKNHRLNALLTNDTKKHVVYYSPRNNEALFPLNAKSPEKEDLEVACLLRHTIVAESVALKREKTPIAWHVLRHVLHKVATKKDVGILSLAECIEEAGKLRLPEPEVNAALDHFTRLNMMHYYPNILHEVVFINLQVLLEKLTELVQRSHELQSKSTFPNEARSGMWLEQFRDRGVITVEHLREISNRHYVDGLFSPSDFLELLEHKHIIAPIGSGEYLMPCILQSMGPEEVSAHRASPSSSTAPLAIHFPGGLAPRGLFCSLVASLLSPDSRLPLQLLQMSPSDPPECVSRNCLALSLPSDLPGSLTLIDAHSHFEIHLDAPYEIASEYCAIIRDTVLSLIEKAAEDLHYKWVNPKVAFLCECTYKHAVDKVTPSTGSFRPVVPELVAPPPHVATISKAGRHQFWKCSRAGGKLYGGLEQRHLVWLKDVESGQPSTASPNSTASPDSTASPNDYNITAKPDMTSLTCFRGQGHVINIAAEIGMQYVMVGTALLNDRTGTIVPQIAAFWGKAELINFEILRRWHQGSGMKDCSWGGLLHVLRENGCVALSKEMEEALVTPLYSPTYK